MIKLLMLVAFAASAQTTPLGQLKVDGKAIQLTNVYAYATEGFFDKKKDDTVVLLTDRPLAGTEFRNESAIRRMAENGKLNCVRATINTSGQIVNFLVGSQAFKALPSGGSTEHVFEGSLDGKSVTGKIRTKGVETFFGTKYEYQATFKTAVQAK